MINVYTPKQSKNQLSRSLTAAISVISLCGLTNYSPSVFAEEDKGYSLTLEEIVVTAQKREQGLMDTAVTVSAFTSQDMANTGALSIRGMDDFIPGLSIGDENGSATQTGVEIRGVSSPNISSGGDPSVATFYDESYVPRAATTIPFSDIARVEVLKGPQGTLFGRNAIAGVISMVPNAPSEEFDAFIRLRAGNYNQQRIEGMLNFAVSDSLFLRANLLSSKHDGYTENVGIGPDTDDENVKTFRLAALLTLSEDTTLQFAYDMEDRDEAAPTAIGASKYAYGAKKDPVTGAFSVDPTKRKTSNDVVGAGESRDMQAFSVKMDHSINDQWSFFAISSFREWDTFNLEDEDGTADPARYFDTNNIEESDIFYNEARFNFSGDGFDLIFGANYSKENVYQLTDTHATAESWGFFWGGPDGLDLGGGSFDVSTADLDVMAAVLGDPNLASYPDEVIDLYYLGFSDFLAPIVGFAPPILPPRFNGQFWTESMENTGVFKNKGVFIDGTYWLNDTMSLAAGLRYSMDDKEYSWETFAVAEQIDFPTVTNLIYTPPNGEFKKYEASDDWSKTTGRLVYSWEFSDDAMFYATYATGYKSGGFDGQVFELLSFAPESMKNFELGLKGDFLDGHLRVESAIFSQELENRQKSVTLIPEGSAVAKPSVISGDETTDGVEIIISYRVLESLRIGANTTYRRSESVFDEYIDASGNVKGGDTEKGSTDNDWTLRVDWTPVVPIGSLLVHVDFVFDEYTADFSDSLQDYIDAGLIADGDWYQADKKKVSARISWMSDNNSTEVALWGNNLLNEDHAGNPGGFTSNTTGSSITKMNAPRTMGIDIRYLF